MSAYSANDASTEACTTTRRDARAAARLRSFFSASSSRLAASRSFFVRAFAAAIADLACSSTGSGSEMVSTTSGASTNFKRRAFGSAVRETSKTTAHSADAPGSISPDEGSTVNTSFARRRNSKSKRAAYLPLFVKTTRRVAVSVDFIKPKSRRSFFRGASVAGVAPSPSAVSFVSFVSFVSPAASDASARSGKATSTSIFQVSPSTLISVTCGGASANAPPSSNTRRLNSAETSSGSAEPNANETEVSSPGARRPAFLSTARLAVSSVSSGGTRVQRAGTSESLRTTIARSAFVSSHSRRPKNTPGSPGGSSSSSFSSGFVSAEASSFSGSSSGSRVSSASAAVSAAASPSASPSPSPSAFGWRREGLVFAASARRFASTPRTRARFFSAAAASAAAAAAAAFASAARFFAAVFSG